MGSRRRLWSEWIKAAVAYTSCNPGRGMGRDAKRMGLTWRAERRHEQQTSHRTSRPPWTDDGRRTISECRACEWFIPLLSLSLSLSLSMAVHAASISDRKSVCRRVISGCKLRSFYGHVRPSGNILDNHALCKCRIFRKYRVWWSSRWTPGLASSSS